MRRLLKRPTAVCGAASRGRAAGDFRRREHHRDDEPQQTTNPPRFKRFMPFDQRSRTCGKTIAGVARRGIRGRERRGGFDLRRKARPGGRGLRRGSPVRGRWAVVATIKTWQILQILPWAVKAERAVAALCKLIKIVATITPGRHPPPGPRGGHAGAGPPSSGACRGAPCSVSRSLPMCQKY